jgi:hypothetical protein
VLPSLFVDEIRTCIRVPEKTSPSALTRTAMRVRYLGLDPTLTQQYDAVWRWIDWPDRKGKPDTGIDLLARELDTAEYTAIRGALYWLQTVTMIGLPPPPPRRPLSVPGMVAVLPGAAGTVPEVLVCVRLNSPPSTVLCQLTAPSWYQ